MDIDLDKIYAAINAKDPYIWNSAPGGEFSLDAVISFVYEMAYKEGYKDGYADGRVEGFYEGHRAYHEGGPY